MIKVEKQDPPEGFGLNVCEPGLAWLAKREGRTIEYPRAFWNEWRECRYALERAFHNRCGYAAYRIPDGQVEHFVSWKRCDQEGHRHLAYKWSNYRWIMPQLNPRKGTHTLLDPFDVEDEWFELDLFTMNLELTDEVPDDLRQIAETTMRVLGLRRSHLMIKLREQALELFLEGLSLSHLEEYCPQVARALARLLDAPSESLSQAQLRLREHFLERRREANS